LLRPKKTLDRQHEQRRSNRSLPSRIICGLVVALTVTAGVYSLYRWCYLPYRCNLYKRSSERNVLIAEDLGQRLSRAMIARHELLLAQFWIERCPNDLDLYMIAGASLRQLGQSRDAIPVYQKALSIDRRPEIYLNLGLAQTEANLPEDAVPNLAAAVAFTPDLLSEVPPTQQEEVKQFLRVRPNEFMPPSR
jgi:tetratricopeptide (TPR) repeat protein